MFDSWLGPTKRSEKFREYYFRFGVRPPKRKFFELFLTPTRVHLVDQISPEGRRGGPLTFSRVWGAY